jgi:hypothetical protein
MPCRPTRRAAIALVAVFALGCASPQYKSGDLHCAATTPQCPAAFYCANARCWAVGSGPGDGGNGDGGDSSLSRCATSTALLCDGFEAAAISPVWTVSAGGTTVTLDNTRAYRGGTSLHVHTASAAAGSRPNGAIVERRTFPIKGTAWVRAWFFFPSQFPPNFDQVINFLDAGTGGVSFSMLNGSPVTNDYAGNGYRRSMLPIPTDHWTCLRISLGQGAPTGDIHLYVDGEEAADAQLIGATITPMVSVTLGADFVGNPAMGPTDAWIDEVIVDDKPIACSD